jgi:hypothetical protein
MTAPELESKAEEITRALRRALPEEPARSLAILCRRVAVLLDLEHDMPKPEPDRRRFRLTDAPGLRGTVRDEPRVYRCGLR